MPLKRKLFILILFFALYSPALKAGDSLSISQFNFIELSDSTIRLPEKSIIDSYLNKKDYNYGQHYTPPKSAGFFGRLWKYLLSLIELALKALGYLPILFRIIIIAIGLLMLFMLITKTKIYKLFYTDKEVSVSNYSEVDLLDETYDFEKEINLFLLQQNFRFAIRLLHLKTLKELEINEVINYSRDKTNREYAKEISDYNMRNTFYMVTAIYNRVWYGNYTLTRKEYESFASHFNKFSAEINAKKK